MIISVQDQQYTDFSISEDLLQQRIQEVFDMIAKRSPHTRLFKYAQDAEIADDEQRIAQNLRVRDNLPTRYN